MHRSMDAHMQRRRDRRRRRCLCVGRSTVAVFYFRATTRPIQTSFVACFRSFRLSGSLSLSLSLSPPPPIRVTRRRVSPTKRRVSGIGAFFFFCFSTAEKGLADRILIRLRFVLVSFLFLSFYWPTKIRPPRASIYLRASAGRLGTWRVNRRGPLAQSVLRCCFVCVFSVEISGVKTQKGVRANV